MLQYIQDYDEIEPPSTIYVGTSGAAPSEQACFSNGAGWCAYAGQPVLASCFCWMDAIYPYIKSTNVYFCPDGPPSGGETAWQTRGECAAAGNFYNSYSYAINMSTLPQWDPNSTSRYNPNTCSWLSGYPAIMPMNKLQTPSSQTWMTDRGEVDRTQYPSDLTSTGGESSPTFGSNPEFRHTGAANFLYCDGQVKSQNAGQVLAANGGSTSSWM